MVFLSKKKSYDLVSFNLVFKLHIMFMRDILLGHTILVQSDSVG